MEGAYGRVSLLIGEDNLRLFPVETRRSGGMALFKSQFGTGWIASGNAGKLEQVAGEVNEVGDNVLVLVAQENKHFHRGDGRGLAQEMPFMQELQGMSVLDEHRLVQRRPGVSHDSGGAQVQ